MSEAEAKILDPVRVPLDSIDLMEGNPNVMPELTFNDLVEDIRADGFDEPVKLIPRDMPLWERMRGGVQDYLHAGGRFVVVSGNHRTKAAKVLNMTEVPAVVQPMSENDAAIAVVRRNIVRGDLDPARMTDLVERHFQGIDHDLLARKFGFLDPADLEALFESRTQPDPKDDENEGEPGSGSDPAESLASMLAAILAKHGETVDQDYIAFIWREHTHFLVALDNGTKNLVGRLAAHLERTGQNINDVLTEVLEGMLGVELPDDDLPPDPE
jgi:ParB-like chromosome segregation protein Spo0J